jgi:hypothetical protein
MAISILLHDQTILKVVTSTKPWKGSTEVNRSNQPINYGVLTKIVLAEFAELETPLLITIIKDRVKNGTVYLKYNVLVRSNRKYAINLQQSVVKL